MRNTLNVNFHLDHINCYDEADGWGSAEPYLWTVFFKIDGTTVRLNDSLMLEGNATIFATPGSHGNLNDNDVDGGDTVSIPGAIGDMSMTLTPIPVPDFVKPVLGADDLPAVAGCIIVLMEEDNVTDDGAEAGHRALNNAVQNALDGLIPTLGVSHRTVTDDDINQLTGQIQSKVEDSIKNEQNIFENIWSWLNPDDTIGTKVWQFSGDDLLSQNPIHLQQRWPNENDRSSDNGDWEIFGEINTAELCPASVVQVLLDALFGNGASSSGANALNEFREKEMYQYKGLGDWWSLAQRNTPYLKKVLLNNKETADAAFNLFKAAPRLLKEKNKPVSDEHFHCAMQVLKQIAEIITNRNSRKDISRSIDALYLLKGKSPAQIFETLSSIKPARYPSVAALGSNFKLKINEASAKRNKPSC
jgi:hypothetical protein